MNLSSIIITGLLMACSLALSIIAHELGHLIVLQNFTKKKIKVRLTRTGFKIGTKEDYASLLEPQYREVITAGIALGALVLFLCYAFLFRDDWLILPLFTLYLAGSLSDIIKLGRSKKREQEATL